jgi:very-short-patch-repair endonuclease
VPERVELWWARRQWSKRREVPYRVGRFRSEWERYPVLVRQYHPDLNAGISLSQVPPAAEVYLVWECDVGHRFVATPDEQRSRPGSSRRRSTWCPECAALAVPRRPAARPTADVAAAVPRDCGHPRGQRRRNGRSGERCATCEHARAAAFGVSVGDAFHSPWAPKTASAAEADLRQRIGSRLDVDLTFNAVRVARPFFEHLEVWPDIILAEFRVALEYDTTGRDGLEHVGRREAVDRRKDRQLRAAGWEVVRIRCGKLQPIGPHDLTASGVSDGLIDRTIETLGEVRGRLIVNSYLR